VATVGSTYGCGGGDKECTQNFCGKPFGKCPFNKNEMEGP